MPQHDDIPEPWFSFLKELDEFATTAIRLDCIGGFVVTMFYGLSRTTGDLDVLETSFAKGTRPNCALIWLIQSVRI